MTGPRVTVWLTASDTPPQELIVLLVRLGQCLALHALTVRQCCVLPMRDLADAHTHCTHQRADTHSHTALI